MTDSFLPPGEIVDFSLLREKRTAQRSIARRPLEALLLDVKGTPTVPVKCWDVSQSGMGFISHHAFQIGERFVVRLSFSCSYAADRLLLCVVRHCSPFSAGSYRGGVDFLDAVESKAQETAIPPKWIKPDDGQHG